MLEEEEEKEGGGEGEGKQVHKVATEISREGWEERRVVSATRLKNNKRGGNLVSAKILAPLERCWAERSLATYLPTGCLSFPPRGGSLKRWLARWKKGGGEEGRDAE